MGESTGHFQDLTFEVVVDRGLWPEADRARLKYPTREINGSVGLGPKEGFVLTGGIC